MNILNKNFVQQTRKNSNNDDSENDAYNEQLRKKEMYKKKADDKILQKLNEPNSISNLNNNQTKDTRNESYAGDTRNFSLENDVLDKKDKDKILEWIACVYQKQTILESKLDEVLNLLKKK